MNLEEKQNNTKRKEDKILVSKLDEYLKTYLDYKKRCENAPATIETSNNILNTFVKFAQDNDYKKVDSNMVHDYILSLKTKMDSTKDKYLKNLKLFFKFLYEYGYIQNDISRLIPKTKYLNKSKLPFIWSQNDISKLLNAINKNSVNGKRDYAIFLIIIKLGLRACDVANLRLENIDWKTDKICFYQHKTTQYQSLPLLEDVGNAIIDYLLDTDKTRNTSFLFDLNNENLLERSHIISKLIYKYEKQTDIIFSKNQKHGVHSLRNTLAYNLLENKTPIGTISQILGHINSNTTMIYLKVDINRLRECILDWRSL